MKRNGDFWISLGLLVLSAIAAALTMEVPSQGTGQGAGPNFIPWLMVAGIALFSLALLWRSQRQAAAALARPGARLLAQLGGFLLLMLAYAVAYEPVGYIVSSLVFFVAALLLLGERRLLPLLAVPPGVVLGVYAVFTMVMKVYLP